MDETKYTLRQAEPADHARILAVMIDWWGGRDLTALLPELFLEHFCDTSFVIEYGTELAAFLVGFMSQSHLDEAYIHFVGVHPEHRKAGLARTLYEQFFEICRQRDRSIIRAITSPINTVSIAYHTSMGFQVERGEKKMHFTKYMEG
jgi:ribosomal protein S18 acetylase RimI-like enzyme